MKSPLTIHRIKHFLEFFSKIPHRLWNSTALTYDKDGVVTHCALGHLGVKNTNSNMMSDEAKELCALMQPVAEKFLKTGTSINLYASPLSHCVTHINDAKHPGYEGHHPKDRILWALNKRLEMETSESV